MLFRVSSAKITLTKHSIVHQTNNFYKNYENQIKSRIVLPCIFILSKSELKKNTYIIFNT